MTAIPPPPTYAPTVGRAIADEPETVSLTKTTDEPDTAEVAATPPWIDALAERLGARIGTVLSETPEERALREQQERDAIHEAAGETEHQRRARHKREAIARRQRASTLWHQDDAERTRRFRRWCILTATSASVGYLLHLPQAIAHLPLPVGTGALILGWAFDHRMRGGGHVRVTQVRGPAAITYLCLVRIPVASALVAVLGLVPLFALTTH